ncbi:MAG: Txe/YoeB family addiction module toxin [Proteobacteria bacterium]|nr:MAG: Txe/YoeB family addiction module toxin [Pseudomonadota bacterium]
MTILSATEARSNLYKLIDQTSSSHEPIIITGKRGNAVLLSEEDWKSIQETMFLLNIPGMRESIQEGLSTKQAQKDARKLSGSGLKSKANEIIDTLKTNPYQMPPPYEKLIGDLSGAYSRRINIQHRIVYQVINTDKVVKVLRMWTHYE